jgi:hypothetical protein
MTLTTMSCQILSKGPSHVRIIELIGRLYIVNKQGWPEYAKYYVIAMYYCICVLLYTVLGMW